MSKELESVTSIEDRRDGESGADLNFDEKRGTNRDVEDMKRMGKEQLFRVCTGPKMNLNSRAAEVSILA